MAKHPKCFRFNTLIVTKLSKWIFENQQTTKKHAKRFDRFYWWEEAKKEKNLRNFIFFTESLETYFIWRIDASLG